MFRPNRYRTASTRSARLALVRSPPCRANRDHRLIEVAAERLLPDDSNRAVRERQFLRVTKEPDDRLWRRTSDQEHEHLNLRLDHQTALRGSIRPGRARTAEQAGDEASAPRKAAAVASGRRVPPWRAVLSSCPGATTEALRDEQGTEGGRGRQPTAVSAHRSIRQPLLRILAGRVRVRTPCSPQRRPRPD